MLLKVCVVALNTKTEEIAMTTDTKELNPVVEEEVRGFSVMDFWRWGDYTHYCTYSE